MYKFKDFSNFFLFLGILVLGIGCSEQSPEPADDFPKDIVGEPIIEIREPAVPDENQSLVLSSDENESTIDGKVLEEGLWSKGRQSLQTTTIRKTLKFQTSLRLKREVNINHWRFAI